MAYEEKMNPSGMPWEGYYYSAYGIAVKHGFKGTEEEWLASLVGKGEKGDTGDPGNGISNVEMNSDGSWTVTLEDGTEIEVPGEYAALEQYASDAEAYAAGTRGGEPVESGDPAYKHNAQYYVGVASSKASLAGSYASDAETAKDGAQAARDAALSAKNAAQGYADSASGSASAAAGSASAASDSADAAADSANDAESAATSAGTAANEAGAAQLAAETAQGLAEEAQGKAETAQGKAEDAQTAAETAESNAAASATSAGNAQTAAEAAQTAAETAQGKAEDAQEAAETAQAAAEAAAASIDPDALKEAIYASFPTDTASGAVASFQDGADNIPVKSLTVNIDPVQAAGTPTPQAPLPISGWTEANIARTGENVLGGGPLRNMILNAFPAQYVVDDPSNGLVKIKATSEYETVDVFTGIFKENTQYTFILDYSKTYGSTTTFRFLYTDGTYTPSPATATGRHVTAMKSEAGKTVRSIQRVTSSVDIYVYIGTSGIFEGVLSADDFVPYVGTTYAVAFPSEAGTVYGGTLTNNDDGTWTLTVTQIFTSLAWGNGTSASPIGETITRKDFENAFAAPVRTEAYINRERCITNIGLYYVNSQDESSHYFIASNNLRVRLFLPNDTPSDFVVQMTGELVTPQTYALTAESVKTLLGDNNIWADCGGVAALTYRADTTLYIDKKLGAGA